MSTKSAGAMPFARRRARGASQIATVASYHQHALSAEDARWDGRLPVFADDGAGRSAACALPCHARCQATQTRDGRARWRLASSCVRQGALSFELPPGEARAVVCLPRRRRFPALPPARPPAARGACSPARGRVFCAGAHSKQICAYEHACPENSILCYLAPPGARGWGASAQATHAARPVLRSLLARPAGGKGCPPWHPARPPPGCPLRPWARAAPRRLGTPCKCIVARQ